MVFRRVRSVVVRLYGAGAVHFAVRIRRVYGVGLYGLAYRRCGVYYLAGGYFYFEIFSGFKQHIYYNGFYAVVAYKRFNLGRAPQKSVSAYGGRRASHFA